MSNFSQFSDTPYQIVNEGLQISAKFERSSQTAGVITWSGVLDGSLSTTKYDGVIVTINTHQTSTENLPIDDTKYIPDPTGDVGVHMGDKLGTALVVGAFYGDKVTRSVNVVGLTADIPYYVTVHAVDSVLQYHTNGALTYSPKYGNADKPDTAAFQHIRVGPDGVGVLGSDVTGFDPLESYSLNMLLDNDERATLDFSGADIQTYDAFITEWNKHAKLYGNPLQSPIIPNTQGYYLNQSTNTVYQYDGMVENRVVVIIDDVEPNTQVIGGSWYNPDTKSLSIWDGINWIPTPYIVYGHAPSELICDDYWFNLTDTYKWNGTVWIYQTMFTQTIDPSLATPLTCAAHWYSNDTQLLKFWDHTCASWSTTLSILWETDPTVPSLDQFWFNETATELNKWNGTSWDVTPVTISDTQPSTVPPNGYWYNDSEMELSVESAGTFTLIDVLVWETDPTSLPAGTRWWNELTDVISQWNALNSTWDVVTPFYIQSIDPSLAPVLDIGTVWNNDTVFKVWDGSEWVSIDAMISLTDPLTLPLGTYWLDSTTNDFSELMSWGWTGTDPVESATDPYIAVDGNLWYDPLTQVLSTFGSGVWTSVVYSTVSLIPRIGYTYYLTSTDTLQRWNGYGWVEGEPKYTVSLITDGQQIRLETSMLGSSAKVEVDYIGCVSNVAGGYNKGIIPPMLSDMEPHGYPYVPQAGGDGILGVPAYEQLGVGTDGSDDERKDVIDSVRHQLGYPTVDVELTKQQFNYAVDGALESIRKRSGMPYKRGFYFIELQPNTQHYTLTDKKLGYNRIVMITKLHRVSSSFLTNTEGQGAFGQMALQQLYHMGSFNLISYHLVSQYVETMRMLFASDIDFNWDEDERQLSVFKNFHKCERVLMEVVVERTEQNILKDRYLRGWIEKYTLVQCRLMLAEVRGKFNSLPGAGGGVSLNAGEQYARADIELQELYDQIDEFVVNNPEEYGSNAFIIG